MIDLWLVDNVLQLENDEIVLVSYVGTERNEVEDDVFEQVVAAIILNLGNKYVILKRIDRLILVNKIDLLHKHELGRNQSN